MKVKFYLVQDVKFLCSPNPTCEVQWILSCVLSRPNLACGHDMSLCDDAGDVSSFVQWFGCSQCYCLFYCCRFCSYLLLFCLFYFYLFYLQLFAFVLFILFLFLALNASKVVRVTWVRPAEGPRGADESWFCLSCFLYFVVVGFIVVLFLFNILWLLVLLLLLFWLLLFCCCCFVPFFVLCVVPLSKLLFLFYISLCPSEAVARSGRGDFSLVASERIGPGEDKCLQCCLLVAKNIFVQQAKTTLQIYF
ncbi:unnamed protein product [Polarella glacialis]|uniref:Uncharacterized protein n=1 Tax=Polarella glacialis TaxID=89957 RepID=A0A813IB16_POLGL|nr:unnamed protein product [Polarella glacialis]